MVEPSEHYNFNVSCSNEFNNLTDYCIVNVCTIFKKKKKEKGLILFYWKIFQSLDKMLWKKYGCVFPFQTENKNAKQCEFQHFNDEEKLMFQQDYKGNIHFFF